MYTHLLQFLLVTGIKFCFLHHITWLMQLQASVNQLSYCSSTNDLDAGTFKCTSAMIFVFFSATTFLGLA